MLKTYACVPKKSSNRLYSEAVDLYRTEFCRDKDRIIRSDAFKRLQYKTQVFINHESDHFRNRMTHSIEVSSIARSLCRALNLSEDLVEAVALAHDLGHSPFGHAGEDALNESMKNFGGFSHNVHSFKILTKLEQKYTAFEGLNLTWEVLEAIVKHNGPVVTESESYKYVFDYNAKHNLDLNKYSSAEAQIAALSDDIAYICHDLEDAVRAKIISYNDLEEIEFISKYIYEIKTIYSNIKEECLIYEVGRKLINQLVESLLLQTRLNIKKYKVETEQDIRCLGQPIVEFTEPSFAQVKLIKDFLMKRVYRHHLVISSRLQSQKIVQKLFNLYLNNIELIPLGQRVRVDKNNINSKMSIIADYIAGMTDRFAVKQYQIFYN